MALADDDRVLLEATPAQIAATGAAGDGTWFLRLWDAFPGGQGVATVSAPGGATTSAEIDIGDGLKITLGAGGSTGTFRRGDWWNCAARADGTTDWPKTLNVPDAVPPHGPEVRYAPLAVMTGPSTAPTIEDCRIPFATLSDRALLYRGGDGQALFAPAGSGMLPLPAKARVAVMRGETPVAGAVVRWSFVGPTNGSCLINGTVCNGTTPVQTTTGTNGLAEVTWSIDASKPLDVHRIQAALVTGPTATGEPPIVFSAVFETAARTGYASGKCKHLTGIDNVQDALDVLCSKIDDKPDALTLTSILLLDQKGQGLDLVQKDMILNALEVRYNSLTGGIVFGFDGGMPNIAPQGFDPIVEVELDLPYPTTDTDRLYWLQASGTQVTSFFGFQRVRLDGVVELVPKGPSGKPGLVWRPSRDAQQFIESAPRHLWGQRVNNDHAGELKERGWTFKTPFQRILCRIRLRSALIWVDGKPRRVYLNAEHLGVVGSVTGRELLFKERDPQHAGDLDIFVYLVTEGVKIIHEAVPGKPQKGPGSPRFGVVDEKSLAPYQPTPQDVVVRMLELGRLKRGERLFDLGSGDGRIVITAARRFGAVATGVESDKRLWQQTRRAIKRFKLEKRARSVLGDAAEQDVSRADLVTLYLGPSGNERIRPMLEQQLKPGARVVSHDYAIPGWNPEETERVEDGEGRGHTLFVYTR